MDREEISNLHRGPSIDISYQVSVHLEKWFQRRRFFLHWPTRSKNSLWRQWLLMYREEISNLYRGSSIDASYQVSLHLAKRFQRRRLKCEKLTDNGCQKLTRWAKNLQTMKDVKSWQHAQWYGCLTHLSTIFQVLSWLSVLLQVKNKLHWIIIKWLTMFFKTRPRSTTL